MSEYRIVQDLHAKGDQRKAQEAFYVTRFLEEYRKDLISDLVPGESPDFTANGIGIEVRDLYADEGDMGSHSKQKDGLFESLQENLQMKLDEAKIKGLMISIRLLENLKWNNRNCEQAAEALFHLIQGLPLDQKQKWELPNSDNEEGRQLPEGIVSLRISNEFPNYRHPINNECAVWNIPIAWEILRNAIAGKDEKKKEYRPCDEYWLLLVNDTTKLSGLYGYESAILETYKTTFDKVLLWNSGEKKYHELTILSEAVA